MQIALWIVQGLLAFAFFMAGMMKTVKSKEELQGTGDRMAWTEDFDANVLKGIGLVEVLGAIGLILPILLGIAEFLTPLAAAGLILTMIGAIITHVRRGEMQAIVSNVVLGAMAAFVLWQYADLLQF
ncbi:MAG: DoxX family protein [Phototrophicaceae bacterium]